MHRSTLSRSTLLASTAAVALTTGALSAQTVSVTIDGAPAALNPAPQERAGRVFVPLRGVFEKLGASVVYANGAINAQGNGHSVALHIGSTQATVDGRAQALDVAPFIIGASTYVPLRFVSQALGANVNWDNTNRVVAITTNGNQAAQNPPPQTVTPEPRRDANAVDIADLRPARGATVRASRPEIEAHFSAPVDLNSVRISLDGRDVSGTSYLNPTQFTFTPPYDLPAGEHTVHVLGKTPSGAPFDRTWRFTTAPAAAQVQANYIRDLRPEDGSAVGNSFQVTGTTLPRSHVRIAAAGSATLGGILRLGGSTYTTDVEANGDGRFSADVPLQNFSGGNVVLQVQSVSPDGQGATAREQLRTQ